jgi:hypothetical protein
MTRRYEVNETDSKVEAGKFHSELTILDWILYQVMY